MHHFKSFQHKYRYAVVVISVVFFCFNSIVSQAQVKKDTLAIARQLRDEKKIKPAISLLEKYLQNHSKDLNANWLLAQTLYWDKQIKAAEKVYEKVIKENEGNYYLKLDYSKMLVELGETDKALPILNAYLVYDANSSDALLALAKISYLKNDGEAALNYASQALRSNPKLLSAFIFGNYQKRK